MINKYIIKFWKMERAKGFEPSTSTLARWSSTTELSSLKNGVKFIINAYNNASKKCNFFNVFLLIGISC